MNITILNGDMRTEANNLSIYLDKLAEKIGEKHTVSYFHLQEMDLKNCTGCWNCWWKTPGKCSLHDDANIVLKSMINSQFVILGSPLIAGFPASLLKRIMDRTVALLHPYIELRQQECHHKKRYENYPKFGLVFEKELDTDSEDIGIIKDIFDRFSINFHSEIKYIKFIDECKIEDIINETSNI
jgi:multimeric flavodoxin WrbA